MNDRNVLSDAESNLSEAMSSMDDPSQMESDDLSEVWELSSICTENVNLSFLNDKSLQSKKKKIIKYLHIKSMSSEEPNLINEELSILTISHDEVLPIFE